MIDKKHIPHIPEYLKGLPPEANLRMTDILNIFGYKSEAGFRYHMDKAVVDAVMGIRADAGKDRRKFNKITSGKPNRWRFGDIRKLVRKIQAECAQ